MDYGKIISRSVNIVWQNKFLIVLGILAALGGGSSSGFRGGGGDGNGEPFGDVEPFTDAGEEFLGLALGLIIAVICVAIFVGLILWAISTIARGGLIAGVDTIESGEKTSFSGAWRAGWQKAWTLLGIGFLPAIPGLILTVSGLLALGAFGGLSALFGEDIALPVGVVGLGTIIGLLACIGLPIVLVLSILRNFAERACMLEDLGVIDSYRRGWNVLIANLGEAVVLFVLQIVIFVVLGIFLIVPGIIVVLCCILWPLLLVAQGAATAFVSSMWTLAWRDWTGEPPLVEKAPAAI